MRPRPAADVRASAQVTVTRAVDSDLARWDAFVDGVPGSDVSQVSTWATVRGDADFRPLRLLAWQADDLVGGVQVLLRRLPILGTVGYVAYGPVIGPAADRPAVRAALGNALSRLVRERVRILFVQPALNGSDVTDDLLSRGFRPSTAGVAPTASLALDLEPDEKSLRRGLSRQVRRWIDKWPDHGVAVRLGDAADVELLADLHAQTAAHQGGFEPLATPYLKNLYDTLDGGGHVALFVGEVDGVPSGATLFTACGGTLKARITGLDRSGAAVRLSVAAAVHWEAALWAKRNGYRSLDFGGMPEDAVAALAEDGKQARADLPGPTRFKASFGGEPYRFPQAVELISPAPVRIAYDLSRRNERGRALLRLVRRRLRGGRG